MKKNSLFKLTNIVYALFIVSTIITIFIVYKNIDNYLSFKFVIGYAIFLLLYSGYLTFVTIKNMRTLKWLDIRKRLFKSIVSFVLFYSLNFILNYVFKHKIDFISGVGSSLGLSVGTYFYDLAFLKNKID
ncbi:hypothetical protein G9F72_003070 [Clostridium estertheticum]|uniref:hypothetical protein n=1 Tax=Clostridium estertheticum TaxID=238834 RepID=UPI0013E99D9B|nr:hypothetical protein [Clostridium estertheticum]MBZ9685331.1 hypothetical protein [Clostridium estertheticum]